MLNFVICEDNESYLIKLSKMFESLFIKHDLDAEVSLATPDPHDILEYSKTNPITVLVLDIDLKSDFSGLELASIIRKKNKDSYLVFTTGHLEYGLMAYQYKTFDFIPKPIVMERLESMLLRLLDDMYDKPKNFIRINNKNTIIDKDSIQFIKKDGMKLIFYTETRKYEVYSSLNKIETNLPNNFIRCHKSYIVNLEQVTHVQPNTSTILFQKTNNQCFIGPKYKNNFMEVFNHYGNFSNNLDSFDNRKRTAN